MVDMKEEETKEKEITKETEVEMTDEQQPNEDFKKDELIKTQAKTIEDQAKELVKLKQNVEILMEAREEKKTKLKHVANKKPIPDHLSPVQDQHLDDLLGIRMKCSGNPGGTVSAPVPQFTCQTQMTVQKERKLTGE